MKFRVEEWVIYSFITLLIYFIVNLLLKLGSKENPFTLSFILYTSGALATAFIILMKGNPVFSQNVLVIGTISGVIGVAGTYFALKSLQLAPNAGYASAIYASYFLLITLYSYLFLHSEFSYTKFLGVLATLAGLILISI